MRSKTSNEIFLEDVEATGMMTIAILAARAGVHRATIMKHIAAGILPAERRTIRGRTIILFAPAAAERYAAQARVLLDSNAKEYRRGLMAANFVSAAELCAMARVSRPTLDKHITRGFVTGERRTVAGRTILAFSMAEADRYAKVARDIVREATCENINRGSPRAPKGYVSLRDLAFRSGRSRDFLYDHIKAGDLKAILYKTAMVVSDDEAERFITRFATRQAPSGLVPISVAAADVNIDPSTVHHAIRYGYVSAVPATNIPKTNTSRGGKSARTLVSLEDVRRYAAGNRSSRRREAELKKMIRAGQKIMEAAERD